ncbi:ankyrin, partial [Peniophora sp. CONT]
RTALHNAAQEGHTQICRLLVEHGAIVTDTDDNGSIALHLAAYYGHVDAVHLLLLLKHGALVHDTDGNQNIALHLAAYYGHLDVVHLLLRSDADMQCRAKRTADGATALHCAAQGGHPRICSLLLERRRALVSETDDRSRIAL